MQHNDVSTSSRCLQRSFPKFHLDKPRSVFSVLFSDLTSPSRQFLICTPESVCTHVYHSVSIPNHISIDLHLERNVYLILVSIFTKNLKNLILVIIKRKLLSRLQATQQRTTPLCEKEVVYDICQHLCREQHGLAAQKKRVRHVNMLARLYVESSTFPACPQERCVTHSMRPNPVGPNAHAALAGASDRKSPRECTERGDTRTRTLLNPRTATLKQGHCPVLLQS